MTTLDLFGIGLGAALVLLFYRVRGIPVYVLVSAAIIVAFAALTSGYAANGSWPNWLAMVLGLLLCAFGLLIVRTMLIRSVSLHLLRGIDSGHIATFSEDIATRLSDMRALSLIRTNAAGNMLTPVGRYVAAIVAVLYSLFRIHA